MDIRRHGCILHDNGIVGFSALQSELRSGIHVVSMVFFSVVLWLRYYYSQRSSKKLIEDLDATLTEIETIRDMILIFACLLGLVLAN